MEITKGIAPLDVQFRNLATFADFFGQESTEPFRLTELKAENCIGGDTATENTIQYVLQHYPMPSFEIIIDNDCIEDTVTSFEKTFKNCTNLASLKIPDFITDIDYMCEGCTSLTEIDTIPANVTTMEGAFKNCANLSAVSEIPSNVTNIASAFECSSNAPLDIALWKPSITATTSMVKTDAFKNRTGTIGIVTAKISNDNKWYFIKFWSYENSTDLNYKIYDTAGTVIKTGSIEATDEFIKINGKLDEFVLIGKDASSQVGEALSDEDIVKMFKYQKPITKNDKVLDPSEPNFILWAKDPKKVVSNFLNEGGGTDIDVYDDEEELIADLSNHNEGDIVATRENKDPAVGVPLGTWASFANDSAPNGEWIRAGSTFDANTFPALAMMLGGNVVPEMFDHNRLGEYENITAIMTATSSSNKYTALYDGFITIEARDRRNGVVAIDINGVAFWIDYVGADQSASTTTFPIKKGDLIYGSANPIDIINAQVRYYTHPLFIKATPTSTDSDYEGTLNAIRQYADSKVSYSTEEVATGGTWIDGKPIYKKTLTATNKGTSSSFAFDQTILNVDTIIKAEGFIKCSSGTYNGMQFQIPRGSEEVNFTNSTGVMTLAGRSTGVNTDFAQITVEYTKADVTNNTRSTKSIVEEKKEETKEEKIDEEKPVEKENNK